MVDWVCPNYLGQLEDFRNRYINPINNGLFHDSTTADEKVGILPTGCLEHLINKHMHLAVENNAICLDRTTENNRIKVMAIARQ